MLPTDVSRHVATDRDIEPYTISVAQASEIFTQAGLPRTERAIQRFCKKGELLCAFQETAYGSRYLIRRSSIDRLIQQKLQALSAIPDVDSRDTSRLDATGRGTSRHEVEDVVAIEIPDEQPPQEKAINGKYDIEQRQDTTDHDTAEALQKLREENLSLKIDSAARQQFINHLSATLEKSTKEVRELSYELGVAHTRVAQLEAPQPTQIGRDTLSADMSRPVATSNESHLMIENKSEILEKGNDVSSIVTPVVNVPGTPQQRSFFQRIFG